jgi:hypothetical protein
MNEPLIYKKAITIKEIKAPALNLVIPAGTIFEVHYGGILPYAHAKGLGVTEVWLDEYRLLEE